MQRVGPRTLAIIDEAGQAGTTDLATAVDFITSRGGSVRLVGDDQQVASVAAGGILHRGGPEELRLMGDGSMSVDP